MSTENITRDHSKLPQASRRTALFIVLLIACALSYVFSISFWASLGATAMLKFFLGLAGFIFESVKYFALPAITESKKQKKWVTAGFSLVIFLVLSGISMLAGIHTLTKNVNTMEREAYNQSQEYQNHLKKVAIQEQKIDQMFELADSDKKSNYRTRAAETLAQISKEQETLESLKFSAPMPKQEGSSLDLPIGSKKILYWVIVGLGALLELTTVYLLLLFCGREGGLPLPEQQQKPKKTKLKLVTKNEGYTSPKATPEPAVDPDYSALLKKISKGDIQPNQKSMKVALKIGSNKATQLLRKMEEEGILIRSTRKKYQLAAA
jgi:ABC-type multidrug transport system fused ATPase/permease subunit